MIYNLVNVTYLCLATGSCKLKLKYIIYSDPPVGLVPLPVRGVTVLRGGHKYIITVRAVLYTSLKEI